MNRRVIVLLSILIAAILATAGVYVNKIYPALKKNLMPVQKVINKDNPEKTIIVYYSYTGNTKKIANKIHNLIGGDIVELEPVTAYSIDYNKVVNQGEKEVEAKYTPELKTKIDNFSSYDKVILGSPIWWYTMAPPVRAFLQDYDFSGKEIIPFYTHGGSGSVNSNPEIAKICPKAKLGSELSVYHYNLNSSDKEIEQWARTNKLIR